MRGRMRMEYRLFWVCGAAAHAQAVRRRRRRRRHRGQRHSENRSGIKAEQDIEKSGGGNRDENMVRGSRIGGVDV